MNEEAAPLPSVREILNAACRDRARILAVAGGMTGLALLAAALLPPRYVASASLVVLLGPEYTVRPEAGAPPPPSGALDSDQIMKAEVEILNGEDLHESVLRELGLGTVYPDALRPPGLLARLRRDLADAARAAGQALGLDLPPPTPDDPVLAALPRFDTNLTIEASKDANVLDVSYRNRDPDVAARVANTLVDLYLRRRQAIYLDRQSSPVEAELRRLAGELAAADDRLTAYKTAHAIASYDTERDLLLHRRADLASASQDAETAATELRQRLAVLEPRLAALPATVPDYTERDTDTRAATLLSALQDLRGKAAAAAASYQPESRMMRDLRTQIATREAELAALRADRSASTTRLSRNALRDAAALDALHATADLRAAEARRATLAVQIAGTDAALRHLTETEATLEALSRQRAIAEEEYRAAARVLDERRVMEEVDASRAASVRVIQPARPPLKPRPLALLLAAAGALLGALGAVTAAVLSDLLRRGYLAPGQIERSLGLPVLAVIPERGEEAPGR